MMMMMIMHKTISTRNRIDRKEEGRGLASIEEYDDSTKVELEEYTKTKKVLLQQPTASTE